VPETIEPAATKTPIPRNIRLLGWVSLLNDIASEMILPLLPLFLVQNLGVSRTFLGVIEGVSESAASFLKLFSGWVSDQVKKRKPLLYIGYGVSTFLKPLFALVTNGWQAMAIRWGDRAAKGIRTTPRDVLVAESATPETRGAAFGFHRSMDTIGAVIGPLLGFALLSLFAGNYRMVFWAALLPGVVSLWMIRGVKETGEKSSNAAKPEPFKLNFPALSADFKRFLLVLGIFSLGNSSLAFLVLRANQLGIKPEFIPLLWMVSNLVYALSAQAFGAFSDRAGRKVTLALGFGLFGLCYLMMTQNLAPIWIWAAFGVYGLYNGITDGVGRAFSVDLIDKEHRGSGLGAYHLVVGIFILPASIIAGRLWDKVSPQAPFYLGAGLAFLAALLLLVLVREKGKINVKA